MEYCLSSLEDTLEGTSELMNNNRKGEIANSPNPSVMPIDMSW